MKRHDEPGRQKFLERSAREAKRYQVWKRVLIAALCCIVVFVAIIYIASLLYHKFGSLTVSVDKFDQAKYALTLSDDEDFSNITTRLNCRSAEGVTNISVYDLPENLDSINGEHNGENYFAYTFYVKNLGSYTITYEYLINIVNVKNDLDEAIRYRVYVDGEYKDYALTRSDGGGAEKGTTEFLTKDVVLRDQISEFGPGAVTKFTVVIWIEGDDPDCVNELLGGSVKSDFTISVIEGTASD